MKTGLECAICFRDIPVDTWAVPVSKPMSIYFDGKEGFVTREEHGYAHIYCLRGEGGFDDDDED